MLRTLDIVAKRYGFTPSSMAGFAPGDMSGFAIDVAAAKLGLAEEQRAQKKAEAKARQQAAARRR